MRRIVLGSIIIAGLTCTTPYAVMAAENLYPNGIEGIKAASVPPPGFYYRIYNVYYTADTLTDEDGHDTNMDFDLNLFVNAHRFIWITDFELLGANYGADFIIPLFHVDLEIGMAGIDDSQWGFGDICVEPFLLAWHGQRYDAAFALAVWAPTGEYDATEPASPGKDMWTYMGTAGGTVYFDTEKTWSASILARYEIHGGKDETHVRPGDDFHFEWGVGKNLAKLYDVGLTGYCQWQVSGDSGSAGSDVKDQVYAIGPEVVAMIPSYKLLVSLKTQWEFKAEDRSEGQFTALTFTKIF